MKKEIQIVIDKASRALKSARREYNAGDYDYACSRSYYAVFYLIEGVLMIDNKRFTKHSAVISFFNKDYIKTGIFPRNARNNHQIFKYKDIQHELNFC